MTKPVALLDANVFPLIWLLWLTDFAEDVEVTSCRACWPLTQRLTTVTGYTYKVGQPRWVKVRLNTLNILGADSRVMRPISVAISLMYGRFRGSPGCISLIYGSLFLRQAS